MAETVDLTGQVLAGTYRVVKLLGEGGMGAVYEAENIRIGKRFAVKALLPVASKNRDIVQRFRREAQIATDLGHPHIVEIIDFNETEDGTSYMVMEYLEGEDLGARLERTPRLEPGHAVAILCQICSALDAAHRNEIVHRDLKPANIYLCTKGELRDFVKVLDFGISKILGSTSLLTQESSLLGTPNYMSPEQAEGKVGEVGPWSDIFSLGSIAYQLVTGRPAFTADSIPGLLYKVVHHQPEPAAVVLDDVPPALSAAIERAMAKLPAERVPSMRAFAAALQAAVPGYREVLALPGADYLSTTSPGVRVPTAEAMAPTTAGEEQIDSLAPTMAPITDAASPDPPSTFSSAAGEVLATPARKTRWSLVAALVALGLGVAGLALWLSLRSDGSGDASTEAATTPARAAPPDGAVPARTVDGAGARIAPTDAGPDVRRDARPDVRADTRPEPRSKRPAKKPRRRRIDPHRIDNPFQ